MIAAEASALKARPERLLEELLEADLDGLLVTELTNVRYLTGYTGTNGVALIGPRIRTFITDFRYVTQAAEEVAPSFERRRASVDLLEALEEALPDGNLRLGFEEDHVSYRDYRRLADLLGGRVELVGMCGAVESLRAIKDSQEVKRISAAARLADAAFERVLAGGLVGRSERQLALALEWEMREGGAQRAGFEPIVATGEHGARPHAAPRDVLIRHGDMVVIDWGAELDGYCSDCTRTVAAGEADPQACEVYELVLAAQLAGLDAIRAGLSGPEVDAAARELIDAAGYGEQFGHGLGHGVGLAIHEAPRLSAKSTDELRAGNVVTVEPGVYLPGRFGIRIEDLVLVRAEGCEILTSLSKDLAVVD